MAQRIGHMLRRTRCTASTPTEKQEPSSNLLYAFGKAIYDQNDLEMIEMTDLKDRLELQWQERLDVRLFDTLRRVATVGTEVVVEVLMPKTETVLLSQGLV